MRSVPFSIHPRDVRLARISLPELHRQRLNRWLPPEGWHWKRLSKSRPDGKIRVLRIPTDPLMEDLRKLNRDVLAPLDDCEWSYCRSRRGAAPAVRAHAGHPYLLHRDISSFFPTTTTERVFDALVTTGFATRSARLISQVCTCENQLPQGAPPSVTLGNLVLRKLDVRIGQLCHQHGLTYTRYVDDIAVSGGRRLSDWLADEIDAIIESEGWTCGSKGGLFSPRMPHPYLGAIVNGIPRPRNEKLSHLYELAREYSAGRVEVLPSLRGLIAWCRALDRNKGELMAAALVGK